MKIRTKISILPIALVTIILIVSLLITLMISNSVTQNQVGNHLLTTAQSRAHHVETLLRSYKETVQLLAVGIPFTNVLDPQIDYSRRMTECNLRIKRTIETNPDISRIRILNKNGIVIASSHEDIGFDRSEESTFIKGNENVYIEDIHISEYTGDLVLSVSTPIFVRDIFSGVVIFNFNADKKLYDILTDRTGLGETGEIYLVNRDGYMISPPRFIDDAILKTKKNTEQINRYFSEHLEKGLPEYMEEKPIYYLDYRGKKVLGVHFYISEMQWGVIAEIDVVEAYKSIKEQTILLIIIFSVLLIGIIIVASIISRNITLPIKELHGGTEEIIKGNLDYKVAIQSKDEIGQLSRSFDIMTDRLKKAQKEMQNHAEELEATVKNRTAELEKQIEKSEKNRIANLVVLNDLNIKTKELKVEITERKRAEEKLKEYSENLEQKVEERTMNLNGALDDMEKTKDNLHVILKSVADGIVVTDNKNRVVLMNKAAEELLNVRYNEVNGQSIDFAIEDKTLREKVKNILEKKTTEYEFDFELHTEDQRNNRIMRARTSVIPDKKGKKKGIVMIIRDVTHEREVDRMKTEFLSTAAHELRTPMTSIQGFSEVLLYNENLSKKETHKFLTYINSQAVNLAKIVNDLLDISRIESGKKDFLQRAPCDFNEMIKRTTSSFEKNLEKHTFRVSLPSKTVVLSLDKNKIEQVLKNILDNAIKYSPKGCEIRIIGKKEEKDLKVSVKDQGIGMTSNQVDKIFDKFYRTDTSDDAPMGTGLGMTIVKYIVEAHNGTVCVESEVGKGTTVSFTIPLKSVVASNHKKNG